MKATSTNRARRADTVFWAFIAALMLPQMSRAAEPQRPIGALLADTPRVVFPECDAIVDVTKPPYSARGDGKTDDTAAIQRALSDTMGQRKIVYLPAGTYLVSESIRWSKKNSAGKEAWGRNRLQGEHVSKTTIRLKDRVFADPKSPQPIMWCGGFGSADWFHNYVQDLTFDVGQGNPGAIGLQFYSNNSGAVRNCRFIAPPGSGVTGLDLAHRDMNGPLLVKNCEVVGFDRGIRTARGVNSQTFEHITLSGQNVFGFTNEGQAISIRGLVSDNAVPAVASYGHLCLIDARLTGATVKAAKVPAVINHNGGRLYLRDVVTTGYSRAIADVATPDIGAAFRVKGPDKPGSEGPDVPEYASHPPTRTFASQGLSLRLPIKEPPDVPQDDPAKWANVNSFGADPTGKADSSAAIQRAMDSGATTIFFPGSYLLKSTVTIGGKVRRIIGTASSIDYTRQATPDFKLVDGESPVVVFEHLSHVHGGLHIDTRRTVILRSVSDCDLTFSAKAEGGELFFEDFVTHNLSLNKQRAWARQLNIENKGTHLISSASDLWILGYKTERGGTLLDSRENARCEVLGGFSYTTGDGKLAPMFINDHAKVFAYFGEVCFTGDPFQTLVQETRSGKTETIRRGEGGTWPYVGTAP